MQNEISPALMGLIPHGGFSQFQPANQFVGSTPPLSTWCGLLFLFKLWTVCSLKKDDAWNFVPHVPKERYALCLNAFSVNYLKLFLKWGLGCQDNVTVQLLWYGNTLPWWLKGDNYTRVLFSSALTWSPNSGRNTFIMVRLKEAGVRGSASVVLCSTIFEQI